MRHTGPALAAAVALVALSLVVVGACGGDGGDPGGGQTPPPAGAADITGRLSQLSFAGDLAGTVSFLVVADPGTSGAYDRAMVRTTADTFIWARQGQGRQRLASGDLHDGLRVAVRFTGPVAESYPVQAVAADVEVLSGL
jgi:hypothetical protein